MFKNLRKKWQAYLTILRIAAALRQKSAEAGLNYPRQVAFGRDLEDGIQAIEEQAPKAMCASHVSGIQKELEVMRWGVERARVYMEISDMYTKAKAAIDKGSFSKAQALLDELEKFPSEYEVDLEGLRTTLKEKRQQLERSRASKDDAK